MYIGMVVLAASCSQEPDFDVVLHECAAMPSPRASSACFVFDHHAYVFAGRDSSGVYQNDLWRYTPANDTWERLGSTPLSPRVNPTACVQGDKVYMGLGFSGASIYDSACYLTDFWEYTPATQEWKRLSNYPNHYTDDATAFADDGELYIGYGFFLNYRRDMFRYSVETNRWDSIDVGAGAFDFPTRSFGGTGCTCQGRHFMGTGYRGHSLDWWGELVDGTHWEKRATIPGKTRSTAASAASNKYIYVSGGFHYGGVNTTGEVLKDIRRYDPQTDTWQYLAILPEALFNHVSFAIGNRVYIGLGETEEWHVNNKLYYFEE